MEKKTTTITTTFEYNKEGKITKETRIMVEEHQKV